MQALDRIQAIQARFATNAVVASAPATPARAGSSTKTADARSTAFASALARAQASIGAPGASSTTAPSGAAAWRDAIAAAAGDAGVDPSLLGALTWTESSFDPSAVSRSGAVGLTQLMPSTAAGLGVDPTDPLQNLAGGARYLRSMLDRYAGRVDLALAAYNAGPAAVDRYGGVPPYAETRQYVQTVLSRRAALGGTIS